MADSSPAPERHCLSMTWESEPLRAEDRIRRQMEAVTLLLWRGLTIAQIAAMRGRSETRLPSERTLRRWTAENLLGFGKEYHMLMRERAIDRIHAAVEADIKVITARAARRSRTPDRTR